MASARDAVRIRSGSGVGLALGLGLGLALGLGCWTVAARGADVAVWVERGAQWSAGERRGLIVDGEGRLAPAPRVERLAEFGGRPLWAMVVDGEGRAWVSEGGGRVSRVDRDGTRTTAREFGDREAFALAAGADGRVWCGLGPRGGVADAAGGAIETIDAGVEYVWDLATTREGDLLAATGPDGSVWRRRGDGEGGWRRVLRTTSDHVLRLAVAGDGSILAGTGRGGELHRIGADGGTRLIFKAPRNEIRAILVDEDGTIHAGTAQPADEGPGGGARRIGGLGLPARPIVSTVTGLRWAAEPRAGENSAHRIGADGAAREAFRGETLIYSMARVDGRIWMGTGPEGVLRALSEDGDGAEEAARLEGGPILALAKGAGEGELLAATGTPGALYRIGTRGEGGGEVVSAVLDAKLPARLGRPRLEYDGGGGDSDSDSDWDSEGARLEFRGGLTTSPDGTWSDWGSAEDLGPGARRFQYRLRFAKGSSARRLRSLTIPYRTLNLAPEVGRIAVPTGEGERRELKWEGSDPNGDELTYVVEFRKEGWPDWIRMTEQPIRESKFAFDAADLAPGLYRARVTADDGGSNPAEERLTASRTSEPFPVDNAPPEVRLRYDAEAGAVRVEARDGHSRLTRLLAAIDGGEWRPIRPEDGILDDLSESATIPMEPAAGGRARLIRVKCRDAAGNWGAADLVVGGGSGAGD